jgi:hypothetical protein
MLQKIQKIELAQAPNLVCTTSAELSAAMQNFNGKQICIFIGQYNGKSWIMYTSFDSNEAIAIKDAVAFVPPCPPYCTEDNGAAMLYVMV